MKPAGYIVYIFSNISIANLTLSNTFSFPTISMLSNSRISP